MKIPVLSIVVAATLRLVIAAPALRPACHAHRQESTVGAMVNTTVGQVQGKASSLRPGVSEYLGIPFAQPPVGELRFAAPVATSASDGTINATAFVSDHRHLRSSRAQCLSRWCRARRDLRPASLLEELTYVHRDCPCNLIPTKQAYVTGPAGEKILVAEAQAGDTFDEDCLTLNVWTKPQTGEANKAVLFWIFGGGMPFPFILMFPVMSTSCFRLNRPIVHLELHIFHMPSKLMTSAGFSIGNTADPIYDGSVLADENDVVVVSTNYRLNIFGFSGAPGQDTNVGLLDQRLALEWTRDNIAAFGGDPCRITVFGQSAGGASTDLIAYAYPNDPIAQALISESGVLNSVIGTGTTQASVQNNWYQASQNAGCGGAEDGETTVTCMKSKSWQEILQAIAPIGLTALMSGFAPFSDGKLIPDNVVASGTAGDFAKLPYLTGSTDDEAAFFLIVALAYTNLTAQEIDAIPVALIQPILDLITMDGFTCPASQAAGFRVTYNVPVWRYRYYGGNYTNTYISPLGSAYHTSELPLVFGTAATVTDIPDSAVEVAAASYMRNAWTTFAKDPIDGLSGLGWPQAGSIGMIIHMEILYSSPPRVIHCLHVCFGVVKPVC